MCGKGYNSYHSTSTGSPLLSDYRPLPYMSKTVLYGIESIFLGGTCIIIIIRMEVATRFHLTN